MCGLGPGSPWQRRQPQTRVSAPVIWQLIGLGQMYQAGPAPNMGSPSLVSFLHSPTLSLLQCEKPEAQKILQNFHYFIMCSTRPKSAIHQVSDSASWGCCKPHGVRNLHPHRQTRWGVCLRASQVECPFQHLLYTRESAVASDQTNIQDVSAELCTWAGCPIQTHTEVLNHNTRIMNESSNTRTPQESLPHRFVFLMMNTNPESLWLRHFKNWQFIFDLGNSKLQNHFNSRSKCSLAPGLLARTRGLHQQIVFFSFYGTVHF